MAKRKSRPRRENAPKWPGGIKPGTYRKWPPEKQAEFVMANQSYFSDKAKSDLFYEAVDRAELSGESEDFGKLRGRPPKGLIGVEPIQLQRWRSVKGNTATELRTIQAKMKALQWSDEQIRAETALIIDAVVEDPQRKAKIMSQWVKATAETNPPPRGRRVEGGGLEAEETAAGARGRQADIDDALDELERRKTAREAEILQEAAQGKGKKAGAASAEELAEAAGRIGQTPRNLEIQLRELLGKPATERSWRADAEKLLKQIEAAREVGQGDDIADVIDRLHREGLLKDPEQMRILSELEARRTVIPKGVSIKRMSDVLREIEVQAATEPSVLARLAAEQPAGMRPLARRLGRTAEMDLWAEGLATMESREAQELLEELAGFERASASVVPPKGMLSRLAAKGGAATKGMLRTGWAAAKASPVWTGLGVAGAAWDIDYLRDVLTDRPWKEEKARRDREWQQQMDTALMDSRLKYRAEQRAKFMAEENPHFVDILRHLPPTTKNEVNVNPSQPNNQAVLRTAAAIEKKKDPATFGYLDREPEE